MNWSRSFAALGLALGATMSFSAVAADTYDVVFGKNKDWLFTGYEYLAPTDVANIDTNLKALAQASQMFRADGTQLVVVLVPSKIRIYGNELPASRPLTTFADQLYGKAVNALRAGGVHVVDLNTPFMAIPDRAGSNQLFYKLDTHWTPKGAALAADTIKNYIMGVPSLAAAWQATTPVQYKLTWGDRPKPSRSRDLVHYLPPGTATFPPEQILSFDVNRLTPSTAGLTGAGEQIGVTAIGSSFSQANTGYPNALRYALQRDVLEMAIPVDQGPWYGMLNYVSNEYKASKPKLVIWEIPERELRSPPSAPWREARFRIDNAQWLSKMKQQLMK